MGTPETHPSFFNQSVRSIAQFSDLNELFGAENC
jgi:hypothetical protein